MGKSREEIFRTAWALAVHQGHWLDRLVLPLLAAGFGAWVAALGADFSRIFFPAVLMPGWVAWVGLLAALEGVFASNLSVKARAPFTLRMVEVGAIAVLTYGLLRAAGAGSSLMWISPRAWMQWDVALPLFMVLFAWYLGATAGSRFAAIGNVAGELGDRAAATMTWEQESLMYGHSVDASRASAVRYFNRRLLLHTSIAALLAAVAFYTLRDRPVEWAAWRSRIALETGGVLLFGLSIQALVYLHRMQTIWRETGVQVASHLPRQWLVGTVALLSGVLVLALILPANLAPLDFDSVVRWISNTLAGFMQDVPLPEGTSPGPASDMGGRVTPLEPGATNPLFAFLAVLPLLLIAVLLVFSLLAVIGAALVAFFGHEWDKMHGLVRIPILVYLWVGATARQVVYLAGRLFRWGRRKTRALIAGFRSMTRQETFERERNQTPGEPAPALPSAVALYIRRLFVLLIESATRQGLGPRPDHTPKEFAEGLKRDLPSQKEEIDLLTDQYLKVRYGRRRPMNSVKAVVEAAWKKVVDAIRGLGERDDRT